MAEDASSGFFDSAVRLRSGSAQNDKFEAVSVECKPLSRAHPPYDRKPGIQSSRLSPQTEMENPDHGRQQAQVDMARHVPVFTGAADGLCGDEVCQSADGAGGAS